MADVNTTDSATRHGRRHTQEEIKAIVARYRRGEATQRDLAGHHGICVGTLQNWLRKHVPRSGASETDWIELIPDAPKGGSPYRIEFPGGPALVLGSGWQAAEVRELVQALAAK